MRRRTLKSKNWVQVPLGWLCACVARVRRQYTALLTLAAADRQAGAHEPLTRPATRYMPRWWARPPLGTTRTLEQAARLAQARARRSPAAALQAPATRSTMAAPRVLFGCLDFIRARARRQHALRLQVARESTFFYALLGSCLMKNATKIGLLERCVVRTLYLHCCRSRGVRPTYSRGAGAAGAAAGVLFGPRAHTGAGAAAGAAARARAPAWGRRCGLV